MATKPDYGLDAPGLCRAFLIGGTAALLSAIALSALLPPGWIRVTLSVAVLLVSIYMLGMGLMMVVWSRIKKVRDRESLFDLLDWRGDEHVLDVGCGRGLLLVGGALRLPQGRAIGIDIWSKDDQAANDPAATSENARLAGVADRVEIVTGDMRSLPFDDCAFDAVMSHWVLHNLAVESERTIAINEMVRVLKPGGRLLIADIANRDAYCALLEERGFRAIQIVASPLRDLVLGALSFGSFVPGAIVANKPRAITLVATQ